MQLARYTLGGRLVKNILACAALLAPGIAAASDDIPTGRLTVDSTLVRVGSSSQLDWSINYPSPVTQLINKDKKGTCTTKKKVRMQIRVLAAAFSNNTTYREVTGYVVVNGSQTQIFKGIQPDVKTNKIVYDKVLAAGSVINVTGVTWDYTYNSRGQATGTKTMTSSTAAGDHSIVALYNGEALPEHEASAYPNMQLNALDYIANYMNRDNTAKIGDNQVIFLGDFNGFGNTGYDLNDFVILVTFTAA
ncbi:MAG: hypothetical protein QM627_00375 [Luteolibacter sp.]